MTAESEGRVTLTAEDLRAEAEECRKSSVNNGEYNAIFWVAGIVLERLAMKLDGRRALDTSHDK